MNSSIVMRNITCLDHSWIDTIGKIHGRSYHVDVEISGKVDDTEQVVLDFSVGKKQLKSIIDDNVIGLDHKLLISPRSCAEVINLKNGTCKLETPYINAILPIDCICNTISNRIDDELVQLFKYKFPKLNFKVYINQTGITESREYFIFTWT